MKKSIKKYKNLYFIIIINSHVNEFWVDRLEEIRIFEHGRCNKLISARILKVQKIAGID